MDFGLDLVTFVTFGVETMIITFVVAGLIGVCLGLLGRLVNYDAKLRMEFPVEAGQSHSEAGPPGPSG